MKNTEKTLFETLSVEELEIYNRDEAVEILTKELKVSQKEVAKSFDLSKQYISDLYNKRKNSKIANVALSYFIKFLREKRKSIDHDI